MGEKAVHKVIKDVAVGIAEAAYENLAQDNDFYKAWPNRRHFVRKSWPTFITHARNSLVEMLRRPEYTEAMKEEIVEILALDRTLSPVQ